MTDRMALFKAAKAAKAQRGLAAPTKEQLKALRAQKAKATAEAEKREAATRREGVEKAMLPPAPRPATGAAVPSADSQPARVDEHSGAASPEPVRDSDGQSSSLPAGFFDESAAVGSREVDTSVTETILPTGFFENKEADAKARGIAPARKKTKEEEYQEFMAAVSSDVRDVEAREQEEAVDAAQERADREAFEQRVRMERIQRLKDGANELPDDRIVLQSEAELPRLDAALLRSRVVKRPRPNPSRDRDSSSDDDEDADLDWRAKGLS